MNLCRLVCESPKTANRHQVAQLGSAEQKGQVGRCLAIQQRQTGRSRWRQEGAYGVVNPGAARTELAALEHGHDCCLHLA